MSTSEMAKFPKNYSPELVTEIQNWGTPWYRAGVVLWRKRSNTEEIEFLLVHEAKVKKDGVWQAGDGGWNLPCGRVGVHPSGLFLETPTQAAKREVREETGITEIELGPIIYIGNRTDLDNPYLIILYSGTTPEEADPYDFVPNEEIDAISWFTRAELMSIESTRMLYYAPAYLRNTALVLTATHRLENHEFDSSDDFLTIETYPPKNH